MAIQDGSGPIATADRTGREVIVTDTRNLKRAQLAREYSIKNVHLVPVKGGVLEFGMPDGAYLSSAALEAVMKMHCDTSGAGYAVYWKEAESVTFEDKTGEDGQVTREAVRTRKLTVGGTYLEAAAEASPLRGGGQLADSVSGVILDVEGQSLVALVARTRVPYFLKDAKQRPKATRGFVLEFKIASMCLVPVLGGDRPCVNVCV
jgi:hypothetical protein